ncbi:hypothetical protein NPIL_327521 [Nephila pilipes]|uniref:Uncharacterized protein n=1 Tax=Nephila pilipes TaxID=299642 RepID=A0A8X6MSJ5_NEPPI|nr:hypothetical protein NPIL_327521 [Nephila pilipes]
MTFCALLSGKLNRLVKPRRGPLNYLTTELIHLARSSLLAECSTWDLLEKLPLKKPKSFECRRGLSDDSIFASVESKRTLQEEGYGAEEAVPLIKKISFGKEWMLGVM